MKTIDGVKMFVGDESSVTRLYRSAEKYIHPGYNGSVNDIAIVLISGTINYGPMIGPACLPFLHQGDSFAGSYVTILGNKLLMHSNRKNFINRNIQGNLIITIVGWGTVEFAGQKSNVLQKADVSVRTTRQCQSTYPDVTNRQICTFTQGKDACQVMPNLTTILLKKIF